MPGSSNSSVRDWLNNIEPDDSPFHNAIASTAGVRKRKRDDDQGGFIPYSKKAQKNPQRSRILSEATGNRQFYPTGTSMGPKEGGSQPTTTPRRGQRARDQILDDEMEEPTPRATRQGGRVNLDNTKDLFPPVVAMSPTRSVASRSSTDTASTRSRSPVKTMADLRMAQRRTETSKLDANAANIAGGVLKNYPRLVQISRGEAVIPHHLRQSMERELSKDDHPPSWAYMPIDIKADAEEKKHQQTWGKAALTIHQQAINCEQRGLTEANWNFKVHNPLLGLVVENPKYDAMVDQLNITHARIQPSSLSPVHLSGEIMQGKMVDLAILLCLHPDKQEEVRRILEKSPKTAQSINQTMQASLREEPIAVNIETKTPFTGGETADLQLAIWSGAGLLRLRQLLQIQGRPKEQIPALPMLSLHGHDAHLSVICEERQCNRVYGKIRIGSTDSVLGVFQVIAGVELLVDWANSELRTWYEENIFQ